MDYKEKVYSILKNIPKGKAMTYKSVASKLCLHPRAVAAALRINKNPEKIPCYKVVHSDGRIGGYSCEGGVKKKIELLKEEGIDVVDERVEMEFVL